MDFLYWQNIDRNNFNIFVRDLSERLNSNVKNIVVDTYNDLEKSKTIKKKKMNKKEMIILEQTIKRQKKMYDDDLKKIQIYEKNIDMNDLYDKLRYIKTDKGILDYKYKLLKHVY